MHNKSEKEKLDKLEASGLLSAARFVKKNARSRKKISADIVYEIHKLIFRKARPDIAGVLRDCEFKKLRHLIPPHSTKVPGLKLLFGKEFAEKIKTLDSSKNKAIDEATLSKVVSVATWASYQISYIHPFHEGNGRTARQILNLILERYNFPAISFPVSPKKTKDKYYEALVQVDKSGNYDKFIRLVNENISEYYSDLKTKKLNYLKSKKYHKKIKD